MTYNEAKAAAIASGIPEESLTAEDIRLFGYEVGDPTAGLQPVVAKSDEMVKDDIALAMQEAQGNTLLSNIIGRLGTLAIKGFSSGVLIIALALCSGCSTSRGRALADGAEKSATTLNDEHLKFEEAFIQAFRASEIERIEGLYADAVKSHTVQIQVPKVENIKVRTVSPDGKVTETIEQQKSAETQYFVNPEIADALLKKKLALFEDLEKKTQKWRIQQATIAKNAANAAKYSQALRDYFDQKAVTFDNYSQISDQAFSLLETFIQGKGKAAPAR